MRWTTWFLFAVALAVFGALFAMVARQSRRTPAEFFGSIREKIEAGAMDEESALANLELALDRAKGAGDAALSSEVRVVRAEVLARIGSFDRARADLEVVHAERGAPRDMEERLIELEARSGNLPQAIARLETLLAKDPTYADGWARAGALQSESADGALVRAHRIVSRSISPEEVARAKTLCERLGALDTGEAERVVVGHHLRALFAPQQNEEVERVLAACDDAAKASRSARDALTRALSERPDPASIALLQDLHRRAGRADSSASIAAATRRLPAVRSDLACATRSLEALIELERWRFASDLSNDWLNRQALAPPEFFAMTCRALHASERWGQLVRAALELYGVADSTQAPWAFFYLGRARVNVPQSPRDELNSGRLDLITRFLGGRDTEPEPGARSLAWSDAAKAARALGEANAEREYLTGAVELDPDTDGELWLRLAELQYQSPNAGYRSPETRFARGMNLLPKRTEELLPRWREFGELELRAAGIDPYARRAEAASREIWTPPSDASPYELFRVAEACVEAKDDTRARILIRKLLDDLPSFLPAIDLAIGIAQRQGATDELVELCVRRVHAVGGDEKTAALLHGISHEKIPPKSALALMRGDPERFGRVAVARTLVARGEFARARDILLDLDSEALSGEAKLLLADLHLELDDPRAALDVFRAMGPEVFDDPSAVQAFVKAALRASDFKRLAVAIAAVGAVPGVTRMDRLALADQLLVAGQAAHARELLVKLDEDPSTRGGDVVLRLAVCALLVNDAESAGVYAERSQAFETGGAYELFELMRAADADDWDAVAARATGLQESRFRSTPIQRTLVALLSNHLDEAATTIAEALEKEPRAANWRLTEALLAKLQERTWEAPPYYGATILSETELLLTGADGKSDPRFAAVALLATTQPLGLAWARERVEALPRRKRGTLWRGWLLAQVARAQDDTPRAREYLGGVIAQNPAFGPAWDLLERLPSRDATTPAGRAELRSRRLAALGTLAGPKGVRLLDRARAEKYQGALAVALDTLGQAAAASPNSPEIQTEIAAALHETGDLEGALRAIRTAFDAVGAHAEHAGRVLHLELLAQASDPTVGLATPQERAAELGRLSSAHPTDPRVLVALAREDVSRDPNNPTIGVARALARMRSFRAQNMTRSLESLAPGGLAVWTELLLEIDPAEARLVLEEELRLEPGSPEAWLLSARALAASGDVARALDELRVVTRLAPGPGVLREMLRWLATREERPERLNQTMQAVMQSEGREEPDAELILLRAEGQWNFGPRSAQGVLDIIDLLPEERWRDPELAERRATLLALALAARGTVADLDRARSVLAAWAPRVRDPYRRDILRVLEGVARAPAAVAANE